MVYLQGKATSEAQGDRIAASAEGWRVEGLYHTESQHLALFQQAIRNVSCPTDAERSVRNFLHPSSNHKVWVQMKSVRFRASMLWWPDQQVWQTVYAGDRVFGTENRHDSVVYRVEKNEVFGILQAIFRHRSSHSNRLALIGRLREIPPDGGNRKVVEVYHNKRFAYAWDALDVKISTVSSCCFVRAAMIVPDPLTVSKPFGTKQRMNSIPDDCGSRGRMRFFELSGSKYTSLAETTSQ